MKYIILTMTLLLSVQTYAGLGIGKVTDVTIRAQDNVMVIRMESYESTPSCVTWEHKLGMKYESDASKALYSMFLAAKTSGQKIRVVGTGRCESGNGGTTGYEVIEQANFGQWRL